MYIISTGVTWKRSLTNTHNIFKGLLYKTTLLWWPNHVYGASWGGGRSCFNHYMTLKLVLWHLAHPLSSSPLFSCLCFKMLRCVITADDPGNMPSDYNTKQGSDTVWRGWITHAASAELISAMIYMYCVCADVCRRQQPDAGDAGIPQLHLNSQNPQHTPHHESMKLKKTSVCWLDTSDVWTELNAHSSIE